MTVGRRSSGDTVGGCVDFVEEMLRGATFERLDRGAPHIL